MSVPATVVYRVPAFPFWKSYVIQMRPYLLFVSGIAGGTGLAMGVDPATPVWKIILSFLPFFLGYGFGQALTDCFQTDTDKISAPYRPLSKGILSVRAVLTVSISGLLCSALVLWLLHPISFLLSLLAVFGLATYSYIKKHFWYGGPFYNAWIIALLPLMGYCAVSPSGKVFFPFTYFPFILVSLFSYANFVLMGYLKDIDADRTTGYKTFPVVFGWNGTVRTGHTLAAVSILLFYCRADKNNYEMLFGTAASVMAIAGQAFAHFSESKDVKDAVIPIVSTVRAFLLFHIAIVLHFQSGWWPFVLVYYALFEWVLHRRPCPHQI
jgi:4-hydroxybenzoate polyprenyltransferase